MPHRGMLKLRHNIRRHLVTLPNDGHAIVAPGDTAIAQRRHRLRIQLVLLRTQHPHQMLLISKIDGLAA